MADSQYTVQDLQDNLNYIEDTKNLIKQAIIAKGQSVSSSDTFRSYKDKIAAIKTGEMTEQEYNAAVNTAKDILGVEESDDSGEIEL